MQSTERSSRQTPFEVLVPVSRPVSHAALFVLFVSFVAVLLCCQSESPSLHRYLISAGKVHVQRWLAGNVLGRPPAQDDVSLVSCGGFLLKVQRKM